ncbi:hypothetical protein [Paludisphaera mucosa]|uniref:Uncharacterized protein n=1 Tax=Paludisphaera mucosa TaxID=3030827 RepID=A0ABT6FJK3_9BACT|nr:hypothetical protein [Paludisphaera mucosa]MDG3007730.1 hypothetical protein [Paludisphaera mucosa]
MTPPGGRESWTMQLPADEVVELRVVPGVCGQTVRRCLEKAN